MKRLIKKSGFFVTRPEPKRKEQVSATKRTSNGRARAKRWKQSSWDGGGRVCALCLGRIASIEDASVDHIMPLRHGGADDESNFQMAHKACNERKGCRIPKDRRRRMIPAAAMIAALLAIAGCAGTMPAMVHQQEVNYAAPPDSSRHAMLEAASDRAAAYADSVTGTAKVAKALAAADITLPQIAAYLAERGWTVRPSAPPTWTWTPAPPGTYPVAYYTWRMVGAVGDTSLVHDIPQAVGPYRLEVRAIDTHQNVGTWSIVGWSDGGDGNNALPGVGE